ncbi:MAG: sigma-54 dependent transcriptional regulator [Muribaculaceae bacterium]|nr:sigma-54 dependent transcriptional regulator [Muribaculaceae bacterium]
MILIVDDDAAIRSSLALLTRRAGYATRFAASPAEAMEQVRKQAPSLVLLDMNFSRFTSGEEGLTLLRQIKLFHPSLPVILMTAWGSIELAVDGMRAGAFDFITKPWDNRRLLERIGVALEMQRPAPVSEGLVRDFIIGSDPRLEAVLKTVAKVAPTNAPVLVTGESGTGKELIAEALHRNSRRNGKPFVKVNLGGLSSSLFESEMFGHKRGAFTDAVADRVGRFEAADGGTIFLDEIGELDSGSQVKLLRVLQEQKFEPLGSSETKSVDVRIVCATNADLPSMVASREFREDLFYRISLVNIELPPLRQRSGDIPALARHFLVKGAEAHGMEVPRLSADAEAWLSGRPWPGNIRELKNQVERTMLISGKDFLTADDFRNCEAMGVTPPGGVGSAPVSGGTLEEVERSRVKAALSRHEGNISKAAAELGLTRQSLYRKMEKFGLR